MTDAGTESQTFDCPRCELSVKERFWGPCTACRSALVSAYRAEAAPDEGAPEASRFEPSMHVVPNHVATKD